MSEEQVIHPARPDAESAAHILQSATALQARAADPVADAWVSASAGTGKTKLLTDRVLRLMLSGTAPERILCLTYTRAAAAEMADRLAERLRHWSIWPAPKLEDDLAMLTGHRPDQEQLAAARRLFAEMIDAPGGMKIMTLHAFCQSVLRRFPLEAGLPPHFALIDEQEVHALVKQARDDITLKADLDPTTSMAMAFTALATRMGEAPHKKLLAEISTRRHEVSDYLARHGGMEGALTHLRDSLGIIAESSDTLLAEVMAPAAMDRDALLKAATALAETGGKMFAPRGAAMLELLHAPAAQWGGLYHSHWRGAFLTQDGSIFKKLINKANEAHLAAMEAEAERLFEMEDMLKALKVYEVTSDILRVGKAINDRYETIKDAAALLDYDDLIRHMLLLLRREDMPGWVMYKLDRGIDHLLIDEAQDTSPEQWEIVSRLSQEFFAGEGAEARREAALGRSVFAVGDQKQSIYSFQGAAPEEFSAARADFSSRSRAVGRDFRDVALDVSFRSAPAVLNLVDAVFADAEAMRGLIFDGGGEDSIHHRSRRIGDGGRVELWPVIAPESGEPPPPWQVPHMEAGASKADAISPKQRMAETIADMIESWMMKGETLAASGAPIRPGDILILLRQRGDFMEEMVRALKARQIPVSGVDRMVLGDQLPVQDLLALADFALLPEDDLTLATLLRAPFIGMSDELLFTLCHGRETKSLWQCLRDRRGEDAGFERAALWLEEAIMKAQHHAPYGFFAAMLNGPCPADPAGSGRRAMLTRLGHEALDPMEELLAQALAYERGHVPSLQGFLGWIRAGELQIKRELEQAGEEVRIMTVHGAKGLEAPVVILPDGIGQPRNTQGAPVLWPKYADDALLWRAPADSRPKAVRSRLEREEDAREAEYRRLLYVALTRARDRLYICGWGDKRRNAPEEGSWYQLVADGMRRLEKEGAVEQDLGLDARSPLGWQGDGWLYDLPQTAPVSKPEKQHAKSRGLEVVLPDWLTASVPEEPVPTRPLTPSRPAHEDPAALSPLAVVAGTGGMQRGRIMHDLLQYLPMLPHDARHEAAMRLIAAAGPDVASAADSMTSEVLAVLDHPDHAVFFGPGSRAEVPITGRRGEQIILGRIDRLAVTDDSIAILDFKTDRSPPGNAAEIPQSYLAQMAAYRRVLAEIYPGRVIRCALMYTLGPRLMELPDRLLAPHDIG